MLFLVIAFHKPSSRKRILNSLDFLRTRGHQVEAREIPSGLRGRLEILASLGRFDLVVIQKKLFAPGQLALIKRLNKNIVFDFDDAVMFHEVERKELLTGKFFKRFVRTASNCKGVIAGNSYLAGFVRAAIGNRECDSRVIVLPTPVDTDILRPGDDSKAGSGVSIGWIGTRGNLCHLKGIAGVLEEACRNFAGVRLKVVSDAKPDIRNVAMDYKPWSAEAEQDDLHSFDIGIMPLEDNIWTRGKGGYKLLQYMAAGVAVVGSPVGINAEIIRHGVNGFLAGDERQWLEALAALIEDPALRQRLGMQGRQTVEREFSQREYNRQLAEFLEGFI
jgi:glycosyltransferase involved in cell wall biosynthesis